MPQHRNNRIGRSVRRESNGAPFRQDAPDRSKRAPFAGEQNELLKKYEQLTRKYEALVKKYEVNTGEQTSVYRLGWWALRTSDSALALFGDRGVLLSNPRWRTLDPASRAQGWDLLTADEPQREFPSLDHLAEETAGKLLAKEGSSTSVARYRRKGGEQVIEVRSERIAGIKLVAVLVLDVSRQVQADLDLHEAHEALHQRHRTEAIGEIASGVAHDLNNALNVMRLRLDLLRRELGDRPQSKHLPALAQIVEDAAARVARVHELSHRSADGRIEPLDLRKVIPEALALSRTELEQRELVSGKPFRLISRLPELPPVRANAAELKHVFVNLVLNSRDAMPLGGTIFVQGWRDGDFAVISVSDEGTGIPEEHLERVFEPFFSTKGETGTGLGLSMARAAMARLGGSIVARNRQPLGVEFVLRFPLDVERKAPALAPAPSEPPLGPGRSLRVLLVDDDPDCLEVTQAVLEAEGLSVKTASSGKEALRILHDQPYDLLLCDIGMPEMSGWQVAQEARLKWPAVPIYMVTGWGNEFTKEDSHPCAVEGVLGKPLDVRELRGAIARIASRPAVGSA
ncbi:MAG TPA: response regulator [Myxococcales bacterium]|nr:response regulator [Myxococcales bacterium]